MKCKKCGEEVMEIPVRKSCQMDLSMYRMYKCPDPSCNQHMQVNLNE